jgi:magnesium-transporting ATPase (P-type)
MSVVVKTPEGVIKVLTKGSDCILNKLLAPLDLTSDLGIEQKLIRQQTVKALQDHAEEGLRTLLICERIIS